MLKKVTFTGVDQKTKVKDLEQLQERYPFVEFGILVSQTNTNKNNSNRYPSLVMLKGMKNVKHLSLHICGKFVRNILTTGDWSEIKSFMKEHWDMFDRIQLNAAGYEKFTEDLSFPEDKTVIIQLQSKKPKLYHQFGHIANVVGFCDNSGGRGVFSHDWFTPENETKLFGFAGGIDTNNILDVIQTIDSQYEGPYWIDMESGVRTNDKFDIKKCEEICEKIVAANLI